MLESAETENPRLISREIIFEAFQPVITGVRTFPPRQVPPPSPKRLLKVYGS